MPKRPAVLVEAHDDIIVIDLMKNPKFAENERVRGILGTLTPVAQVAGLSTEGDFLIVQLRVSPFRLPRALNAARARRGLGSSREDPSPSPPPLRPWR